MRMTKVRKRTLVISLMLGVFLLTACGGTSNTSTPPTPSASQPASAQVTATSTEQPVTPIAITQAGASDIPDSQTFVSYSASPGGYSLDVPEGWARTTSGANVNFVF